MDSLAPTARVRAYAPEVVEHVLGALATDRHLLEQALEEARRRIDAAQTRLTTMNALRDRIGGMVLEAERRLAQHDTDTRRAVVELLATTDAEVDAAIAAARAEVARRKLVAAVRNMADESNNASPPLVIHLDEHHAVEVG